MSADKKSKFCCHPPKGFSPIPSCPKCGLGMTRVFKWMMEAQTIVRGKSSQADCEDPECGTRVDVEVEPILVFRTTVNTKKKGT